MNKKKILPPTIFWISLVLSIGLHFILPIKKFITAPYNYIGILPICAGVFLNLWTDRLFKNKHTTVKPFEKSSYLIEEGPFVFSRNPMYLGMTMILLGTSITLGSVIPFIITVVFHFVISLSFILPEEQSLEETFGQDFIEYKKRVRRWL
jgi:protein-S-isoprenylcysteine O-methyltransferase Ste14